MTGRTMGEIPLQLTESTAVRYIIFSDGAAVLDKAQNKIIISAYMRPDEVTEVYEILNGYDTMIEIFSNGQPVAKAEQLNDRSFEYFEIDKTYLPVVKSTRTGVGNMQSIIPSLNKAEMFNVFFKSLPERAECLSRLENTDGIFATTSMRNNLEIMSDAASKGKALDALCRRLNINPAEIIAVGDSSNDITMFNYAGLTLAPVNACAAAKEQADKIICSNNDNVAEYILSNYFEV